MLALDIGQHQRAGDSVQHFRRRSAAAPLLKPSVPGRAYIGPLGNLLPAQPLRSSAGRGETQGGRIEASAAILEIGPQPVIGLHGHADLIGLYTLIM
jgi:hypothetical protein